MNCQEAINTLKDEIKCSCYRNRGYCGICTIYSEMDRNNIIDACKTAISAMQELQEYRRLGTLEEVRDAVEKQKRKKPCASNRCYVCPRCGLVTSLRIKHNYCDACGQHIDWSEEE